MLLSRYFFVPLYPYYAFYKKKHIITINVNAEFPRNFSTDRGAR